MKNKRFLSAICLAMAFTIMLPLVSCERDIDIPQETEDTVFGDVNTADLTDAPTEAPTEAPTDAPTEAPTDATTEAPTDATTEAPTKAPTDAPTEAPTDAPTEAPTDATTEAPTEAHTDAPTEAPTDAPTEAPTDVPTEAPTEAPCDHYYKYACATVCRYCGEAREASSKHSVRYSCSENCSICNERIEGSSEHSFPFPCSDNCTVCGKKSDTPTDEHSFPYDCTDRCAVCGQERDPISPHDFNSESKCENISCSVCGLLVEQEHDWVLISDTATFLSAGTKIEKCSVCDLESSIEYGPVDPASVGMPVVYIEDLEGSELALTKLQKADGEITVKYRYVGNADMPFSFECFSSIKVQGASSAGYPKKNYTVKFYEDEALLQKFKVDLGWGRENRYCMKANYVDFSQARNIVGAQMFAQLVASRDNVDPGLASAPNYGVIDGYPILVVVNGVFHGLYTMNIPKDHWMFGMKGQEEDSHKAILMAADWKQSDRLKEEIGEGAFEDYGWEVEHCSTTDQTWIKDSFNQLIALINCGDDARIRSELADHLDIEAAIDNMIFTYFVNAADNVAKNILWATYDGMVWIPSMYDMDGTFGIYYNGTPIPTDSEDLSAAPRNTFPKINSNGSFTVPGSEVFSLLVRCFPDEVEARYRELRTNILTVANTRAHFEAFYEKAPMIAYRSDLERWPKIPHADTNLDNMYEATRMQLARLDSFFYNFNP